jgi:cytochrome c biogenesis protein CcmG/thiol:disulfide interchange protein DsbE
MTGAPRLALLSFSRRSRAVNRLRLAAFVASVLLVCVAVGVLVLHPAHKSPSGESALPGLNVGQVAPQFRLKDLSGKPVSLQDYHGRWVLINFWGVTCIPCRSEMPALQRAFQTVTYRSGHASASPIILGIDGDGDNPKQIAQFVRRTGVTYPILVDSLLKVMMTYHVGGIPASVLVTPDGKIGAIHVGPMSETAVTSELLGKAPS